MVEIKKPKLKDGKEQLPARRWVFRAMVVLYLTIIGNILIILKTFLVFPTSHHSLSDVLNERFTIDDLIAKDLINKKKSLKDLILEMEDEVLANAGVDVFEEVFQIGFYKVIR